MRWLFIVVLAALVACVLSIVPMNDTRLLPPANTDLGSGQGSPNQNPLTIPPPAGP